jgi:hypothetical protein
MDLPREQVDGFRDSSGRFRVNAEGTTFNFLGVTFDFSDTFFEVSEWRSAKVTKAHEGPGLAHKLELVGCTKETVWPRFLPK